MVMVYSSIFVIQVMKYH